MRQICGVIQFILAYSDVIFFSGQKEAEWPLLILAHSDYCHRLQQKEAERAS